MLAVPSDNEGRPIAEPDTSASPPAFTTVAPARSLTRNVPPQLNAEELAAARKASYMRLFDTWNDISERYGAIAPEEDDEVDLVTGQITRDRGRIRDLQPRAFAEGVNFEFDDDGLEEEDDEALGEESDVSVLPFEGEEFTPEPDVPAREEDHPMLQEQPWSAEDDRDLQEFLYVENMRRRSAGETVQDDVAALELAEGSADLDMEAANMGAGQMGLIAQLVRREVERMLGAPRPSPPFPHAAARMAAGRSAPPRLPTRQPPPVRPQSRPPLSKRQPSTSRASGSSKVPEASKRPASTEPSAAPKPRPEASKPPEISRRPASSKLPVSSEPPEASKLHPELSRSQTVASKPPAVSKYPAAKGPVSRVAEKANTNPRTPSPAPSITKSNSLPDIPSALKNRTASRSSRPSLGASKVRFADDDDRDPNGMVMDLEPAKDKGKQRMAGERPEDGDAGLRNPPEPSTKAASRTSSEPLSGKERSRTPRSTSPSSASPSHSANGRRRKRRISEESDGEAQGGRERYRPTNVYLKSLSYHGGMLRECTSCLEAGEPRSRYAALCRGRIDSLMCRFPHMLEEEIAAAFKYREDEEAAFQASKKPEARLQKRTKTETRAIDPVTEIPTSWRPRPGDTRYSMAPHRVRGGTLKRCKLCVVAGGVREKRSMFCMGRSGHGKCAFETEDPSGSSGDEEETPEQAAIKQMEHRLLRAQNARLSNISRAIHKEETPAAPPRKSTTPYVSYRQGSTRPGLPATRGAAKKPEGEDLNPRAPNGRLKPRCGPCLRAGGERAERAFLCPGSGRPKYCDYAPGASSMASIVVRDSEDSEDKDPIIESAAAQKANGTVAPPSLKADAPVASSTQNSTTNDKSSAQPAASSTKATEFSAKGVPKKKKRKLQRHHRLGSEESSAEDYETEESDFTPEFADSDDSLDDSSGDEMRTRRIDLGSTGYRIDGFEEELPGDMDYSADWPVADEASFESAEPIAIDTANDADVEDVTEDTVNPQILANIAASMNAGYAPRPESNAYAPYLSFQSGGSGWLTCTLCEKAGGARAEAAMWCYGRDGADLCRLTPRQPSARASASPVQPNASASPKAVTAVSPNNNATPQPIAPDTAPSSPDHGVFSPDHSPDPLASDYEMDDVNSVGLSESGQNSDLKNSRHDQQSDLKVSEDGQKGDLKISDRDQESVLKVPKHGRQSERKISEHGNEHERNTSEHRHENEPVSSGVASLDGGAQDPGAPQQVSEVLSVPARPPRERSSSPLLPTWPFSSATSRLSGRVEPQSSHPTQQSRQPQPSRPSQQPQASQQSQQPQSWQPSQQSQQLQLSQQPHQLQPSQPPQQLQQTQQPQQRSLLPQQLRPSQPPQQPQQSHQSLSPHPSRPSQLSQQLPRSQPLQPSQPLHPSQPSQPLPPSHQLQHYREPRPLVSSDRAPSSSPQPSPYPSPPMARSTSAADGIQATLALSIKRNFLAPPPSSSSSMARPQQPQQS